MTRSNGKTETIIVGGGQSGLTLGYHLARRGRPFQILDAHDRIGDAWRTRWDSLRLFTPAKYDGLAGMRFPAKRNSFPTKDQMADYLEAYARRFDLPVQTGVRIDRVARNGDGFIVTAGEQRYEADNVVLATGAHRIPKTPPFAEELDPSIRQIHSFDYKNPAQLRAGSTLIVGLGNSGAEIAFEIARTHRTLLSGVPSAQIPVKHGPWAARTVIPIVRFMGTHVLTERTPIGRKVKPVFVKKAAPLIRVKQKDLIAAGVEQLARVTGVEDGWPLLADGRVLRNVENIIWCTGFHQRFDQLQPPAVDDDGAPVHDRGVARHEPGLYFMGLRFQYAAVSETLPGVSRDAKYIANHIASRATAAPEHVTPEGVAR